MMSTEDFLSHSIPTLEPHEVDEVSDSEPGVLNGNPLIE